MPYITDDNNSLIEVDNKNKKPNLECLIKEHTKEVERIEKIKIIAEFYKSLIDAVESAGGATDWINEGTTLKELADILAVNDVRFHLINQNAQRGV
jgi:hypothetical protein